MTVDQGRLFRLERGRAVPRYFFHLHDGELIPDEEGTDLPDVRAAQREAVQFSARMLSENAERFWRGDEWKVEVTDRNGLILFTLIFVALRSPAMQI